MSGVQIGSFAMRGEPVDGSGPQLTVVVVSTEFVLEHGVPKSQREMLQFEAFTSAAAEFRGCVARPGDDPPDLIVARDGEVTGVELTQLSVSDLRADVAKLAEFGHLILARIDGDPTQYSHLLGRSVDIMVMSVPRRRAQPTLVEELAQILLEDVGFVGEGLVLVNGELPADLTGKMRGIHPTRRDGTLITIQPGSDIDGTTVQVRLASGLTVKIAEVAAALEACIAAKDVSTNEVLLISTGVPDHAGAVFPLDSYLLEVLRDYELPAAVVPAHLEAVYLHHWPSFDYRCLYRRSS